MMWLSSLLHLCRVVLVGNPRLVLASYLITGSVCTATIIALERLGLNSLGATTIAACLLIPLTLVILISSLYLPIFSPDESVLIGNKVGKYKSLRFEEQFRSDIGLWKHCTIETLYFGCELLLSKGHTDFLKIHESQLLTFLGRCYDNESGLYRLGPDFGRSSAQYSHCAVGVLKSLAGVTCKESIGIARTEKFIGSNARRLVDESFSNAMEIINGRRNVRDGTIIELYACYGVLRNLDQTELLARLNNTRVELFLRQLFDQRENRAAFRIAPHHEVCINATYFAIKLLPSINSNLARFTSADDIVSFIETCWDENEGGFSSMTGHAPTIMHTKMALDIYRYIGRYPTDKQLSGITRFVEACKVTAGFAFRPGLQPNLYATRCALETLVATARSKKELGSDIGDEIIEQFYVEEVGGFSGYPAGRSTVKKDRHNRLVEVGL